MGIRMKNKLLLFYSLPILFISNDLNCPIKSKNSVSTASKNTQATLPKNAQTNSQEAVIIDEIKSLLAHGKVPSLSFNEWVDTHTPILLKSDKDAVKKLGETLQAIRKGDTAKISAFKVLPNFEKAVQEYDSKFRISMLSKPIIIAKGTYWYFSAPKKK